MSSAVLGRESSRRRHAHAMDAGEARRVVSVAVEQWKREGGADARAVLGANPGLQRHKSLVVELAYEAYCLRVARGERLDVVEYCRGFPEVEHSLWRQLALHDLLGQSPELPGDMDWPDPGEPLAGYLILEELGRGAFSRVYLAAEQALGHRLVAIKLCPQGREEADTLGRLQHPHIVQVHSVRSLEDGKLSLICMPYLGRATLEHVLVERRWHPLRRAADIRRVVERVDGPRTRRAASPARLRGTYADGILQIAAALAEALHYAHGCGVVHLDLKPSNVLISSDGTPRLLDFNLCYDEDRFEPRLGGTLSYMSPEQVDAFYLGEGVVEREGAGLDGRSDVFSLGVILCELLTGRFPFDAPPRGEAPDEAAVHLRASHRRGPQGLTARSLGVSPACARLLKRCLAEDPAERPATAGALARSLRRETRWTARQQRALWRQRWVLGLAALLTGLALSPLAVHLARRPPFAERQLERARQLQAEGQYERALECVERSLRSEPSNPRALFLRGRLHAEQKDYPAAIRDLQEVVKQTEDPQAMAYLGYCCALFGAHRDACHWYTKSVDRGSDSVAVLNNLAYSEMRRGNDRVALSTIDRALGVSPSFPPARYNRALFKYHLALKRRSVPTEALQDIRVLTKSGAVSHALLRDAARVICYGATIDPEWTGEATRAIVEAMQSGHAIEDLTIDPFIRRIVDDNPWILPDSPSTTKRPELKDIPLIVDPHVERH